MSQSLNFKQTPARVLVVGSGAREHALAWKCMQSPLVGEVFISSPHFCLPPHNSWNFSLNGGKKEFQELAQKAIDSKIDLIIIGPDNPLSEGIVDVLSSFGLTVFGPSQKAAQIESSKSFAKMIMKKARIPTPEAFLFLNINEALKKLEELSWDKSWVLKADGLALGKGVVICQTLSEAKSCLERLFSYEGHKILIEEFIEGNEVSWMAMTDGKSVSLLDPAQDYKRVFDGDKGSNTGGMGSYSPVSSVLNSKISNYIKNEVFMRLIDVMNEEGIPFCGVLYAGLMIDFNSEVLPGIPKISVLEFNARFGDPEAQVLLPRMKDDFFEIAYSCAKGNLARDFGRNILFNNDHAVYVVAASEGYPEAPLLNQKISPSLDELFICSEKSPKFFAGGVKKVGTDLLTSGGRVLGALGQASSLSLARSKAYENLSQISFQGMHFRKDIAYEK